MATAQPVPHDAANDVGELAPLLAGAHARGMFDALDLMGQGAVLLGRDGRALAVTQSAAPSFGAALAIVQGRPVSAARHDDSLLQQAILDALAGVACDLEIGAPGEELTLRLLPTPAGAHQLMAAILLIQPPLQRSDGVQVPFAARARETLTSN